MHLQLFISATVLALSSFVTDVQSKGDDSKNQGISVQACKNFVHAVMDSEGIDDPTRRRNAEELCETSTASRIVLKERFALKCKSWCKQNNVRKEHPDNCELVCSNPTFDRRYVLLRQRENSTPKSPESITSESELEISVATCQNYVRAAFDDAGDNNQTRRLRANFICERSRGIRVFLKELFENDCHRQCTNDVNSGYPEYCALLCQSATYDPKYVVLNRPTALVRFPTTRKEITSINEDEGISVEDCKAYAYASMDEDEDPNGEYIGHADFICQHSTSLRVFLKDLFEKECTDWCMKNNPKKDQPDNCEIVCRNPRYDPSYVTIKLAYFNPHPTKKKQIITRDRDSDGISPEDCVAYAYAGLDKYGDHDLKHRENVAFFCEISRGLRVFLKELFGRECRDWCIQRNETETEPYDCELVCRKPTFDRRYAFIQPQYTKQHPMFSFFGIIGSKSNRTEL